MKSTDIPPSITDLLPPEILLLISNEVMSFEDFCALRATCKNLFTLCEETPHFGRNSFFRHKYEYFPQSKQYIERIDSLSLIGIRYGNWLTHYAMLTLISKDLLHAESILRFTAYGLGNPYAMQIINMLASLPGRISKIWFPQEMIEQYQNKMLTVLKETYKKYYPENRWSHCEQCLMPIVRIAEKKLNLFLKTYKAFYIKNGGVSLINYQEALEIFSEAINDMLATIPEPPDAPMQFLIKFKPLEYFNFLTTADSLNNPSLEDWFYPEYQNLSSSLSQLRTQQSEFVKKKLYIMDVKF